MTVFPTNAVLTFQLPTGSAGSSSLGNPVSNSVELVVEASFKKAGSQQQAQGNDGEGYRVDRMKLEGRCNRVYRNEDPIVEIIPPSIPTEVVPGTQYPCTLTEIGLGTTREGYFILEISLASRWRVDPILGGKINGWFLVSNVMGELA